MASATLVSRVAMGAFRAMPAATSVALVEHVGPRHGGVDQAERRRLLAGHGASGEQQVAGHRQPTTSGNSHVVAMPGCIPRAVNGTASLASSAAYRRSQARARTRPAPIARPVDRGDRRHLEVAYGQPAAIEGQHPAAQRRRPSPRLRADPRDVAPEQKALPAPVTTTQRADVDRSKLAMSGPQEAVIGL